jgi:DNA polymerase elongation subunit (family B)
VTAPIVCWHVSKKGEDSMDLATLVRDIHRLNHELERFENKYGVMSQTFYESYIAGEEPADDAWVLDFEKWAGLYEVRRDKQQAYDQALRRIRQDQPSLAQVIQAAAV